VPLINFLERRIIMETMTLELILVNDDKEKLLKFLEENRICYERYGSSYSAFLEEEARCQLENFLYDYVKGDELDALIRQHAPGLADAIGNSDYVIDCDVMCDIVSDYCNENELPGYREEDM
jgi:hypothetical protein